MGVNLGLIRDVKMGTINKLFVHTQPGYTAYARPCNVCGGSQHRTSQLPTAASTAQTEQQQQLMRLQRQQGSS
ncbi:MAG: hypothetical protein U0892_12445 [Pirellulales bacterium]